MNKETHLQDNEANFKTKNKMDRSTSPFYWSTEVHFKEDNVDTFGMEFHKYLILYVPNRHRAR